MPKSSQNEADGLIWQVVPLALGEKGMDARRPSEPDTLVDVLNAKFIDARTIARRGGHDGYKVQDNDLFLAPADSEVTVTDEWFYGHGIKVYDPADADNVEDAHYPLAGQAKGTFESNGKSVVWTGDRLIVEGKKGSHIMWGDRGMPAYLPVQEDAAFSLYGGQHVDSCLTEDYEVTAITRTTGVSVAVKGRDSGLVLFTQTVGLAACSGVRLVNSGGKLLLFFTDTSGLWVWRWLGTSWGHSSLIEATATVFDVAQAPDGCEVIWDKLVGANRVLKLGNFTGHSPGTNHTWGQSAEIGGAYLSANPKVGLAVASNGDIAYAWTSNDPGELADGHGLYACQDNASLTDPSAVTLIQASVGTMWATAGGHVTVTFRNVSSGFGKFNYTVYAKHTPNVLSGFSGDYSVWDYVRIFRLDHDSTLLSAVNVFNAKLLTKAFTVGNEVFAWLYSINSSTAFLVGNDAVPQMCGIADREEVEIKGDSLRSVQSDPLDQYKFIWSRPYNAGEYFRRGDVRIGYLNFMPKLSTAAFGLATYVAGSHVRCWDGVELGDAGFHDYPSIESIVNGTGGSVSAGEHFVRVYPVRYTSQGERFQGAAITSSGVTVSTGAVDLALHSIPITNHDDVKLEVYMTPVGSTVFRYAGVVDNDRQSAVVTIKLTASDTDLESAPADPHAPGVDDLQEMEEFGPVGCEILAVSGDRLWGIGGQVPAGCAQFSKLYEVGEGVGFGDLINTQIFDASGNRLTSIASFSDSVLVAFQAKRYYSLLGPGPSNFGIGSFDVPELKVAAGALNHWGTIATPIGLLFWSEEGPRALAGNYQNAFIGEPIAPLALTMTPSGVRFQLDTSEVIWYTESGNALLYNFGGRVGRFARWSGIPAAGVSDKRIVTPSGECWTPSSSTPRDYGRSFVFSFETGNVRLESLLQGGNRIRSLGMTGKWVGEHTVTFNVYHDGSPDWIERIDWVPGENSVLNTDWTNLTGAQIDALDTVDKTGRYDNFFRLEKQDCEYIRVKVTDSGNDGFIPWELSFEMASKGGKTRLAAQTLHRNGE